MALDDIFPIVGMTYYILSRVFTQPMPLVVIEFRRELSKLSPEFRKFRPQRYSRNRQIKGGGYSGLYFYCTALYA
jgi:hypothetical protein